MNKLILTPLFLFTTLFSIAQISVDRQPISSTTTLSREVPTVEILPPNINELELEDEQNSIKGKPYRYATFLDCDIDTERNGLWENIGEYQVWRLKIKSANAQALGLYFDAFWIPSNGELYVYNSDKSKILGAYTNINNHPSGIFAIENIEGDELIIEYLQKGDSRPILHINNLLYAYRSIKSNTQVRNFGDSGNCQVNVNCSPEGDNWKEIKTSVCRISIRIDGNAYWCSGSLMNNTAEDCKPYVLTADHCAFDSDNGAYATQGDMNQWIFYFNYEANECENPTQNPSANTLSGCSYISRSSNNGNVNNSSDFHFVELNNDLPFDYGLYAAGWNRNNTAPSQSVGIHHPAGDIKKISSYNQSTSSGSFDWRVRWVETETSHGVTEGGSSGSPLFNSDQQVVGTLSTGSSACSPNYLLNGYDYYGKFSYSWNQNGGINDRQLRPWLDPLNTGATELDAKLCGTPLVANFKASHTNVLTGYSTQFSYTGTGNPTTFEWSFYGNGVSPTTSNETAPIVNYSIDGQYTVRLQVTDDTNDSYELKAAYILVNQNGSSIDVTENKLPSFNIFPNPSTGIFYVTKNNIENIDVEVYSLLGQKLYSTNMNNETMTIDLSNLPNGVYTMKLNKSNFSSTKRLIINK